MVKSPRQPDGLLGSMQSLADTTRLRLLHLLEGHELGVADLCDVLQMPQSTVSRHLKVLAGQKWLRSRREGTNHLYRMILDELALPARKLWLLAREQTEGWAELRQDNLRLQRRISERKQDSQAFFAGAAAEWDRLRSELYGNAFSTAAMLAALAGDQIIADLGCGTGTMTAALAPVAREVIGVDNSPAMLKAAQKRTAKLNNVRLKQGNLESLPIESGSCDVATIVLSLTYVEQLNQALKEAARILKPAGRLVIVDLLPHDRDDFRTRTGQRHNGLEPEEIEQLLRAAGMENIRVAPLPPEPAAKGPALFLAAAVRNTNA